MTRPTEMLRAASVSVAAVLAVSIVMPAPDAGPLTGVAPVLAAGKKEEPAKPAESEKPVEVAPGVWFLQTHDIGKLGSNKGWIIFDDFVVVIDAGFPIGSRECLDWVRKTTDKPVRYVVDTHYHADHALGNHVFTAAGATVIAHESSLALFRERNPGELEKYVRQHPAGAGGKLAPPGLTFGDMLVIDDGKRRVEIRHLGHAHTPGCVWTFLPKEKILFSGDACVNGPFNYLGDAKVGSWIEVLKKASALGAETLCPGHGAKGDARVIIGHQLRYLEELHRQVAEGVKAGKSLAEVRAAVDIPAWKAWTGLKEYHGMFVAGIETVYKELGGVVPETPKK